MGTKAKIKSPDQTRGQGSNFSIGSVFTKAILCLHSITALHAVIMSKDIWKPHNILRLVVC